MINTMHDVIMLLPKEQWMLKVRDNTELDQVCATCNVAFDVGYTYCREKDCPEVMAKLRPSRQPAARKSHTHPPTDPIRSRLLSTKQRSKKKGMEHDLTIEFIQELINSPCVYCGSDFLIQIDRKDNLVGYTQANVVAACKRCNTVKSMYLTYEQMIKVAEALGWRN